MTVKEKNGGHKILTGREEEKRGKCAQSFMFVCIVFSHVKYFTLSCPLGCVFAHIPLDCGAVVEICVYIKRSSRQYNNMTNNCKMMQWKLCQNKFLFVYFQSSIFLSYETNVLFGFVKGINDDKRLFAPDFFSLWNPITCLIFTAVREPFHLPK